jgi:hypothetical protein
MESILKKAKVVRATLRTELENARKALEGLQRLKAVLPMLETQRDAVEAAMAAIRFAWRSHKLEPKIGEYINLSDYAARALGAPPAPSWRIFDATKTMRAALKAAKTPRRAAKK